MPSTAATAEPSHKRQQQPRVREQVSKRGRNRGPSSRPTSAGAKPRAPDAAGTANVAAAGPDAAALPAKAQDHTVSSSKAEAAPAGTQAAAKDTVPSKVAFTSDTAGQAASSLGQLNLDPPVRLSPALDPVARLPANTDGALPDLRGLQIERPNSAKITAVGRPKSAGTSHNAFSSASSGAPQDILSLPVDLTFDSVLDKATPLGSQQEPVTFGGLQSLQHSQQADRLAPGPFQSGLFPLAPPSSNGPSGNAHSSAMWQQPAPPARHQQQQNPQPNIAAAVESFFAAGNPSSTGGFGSASSQPFSAGSSSIISSKPPLNLPQFGSFGAGSFGPGLQFGQLGNAFGQSPFIPTGKQPDWSTGPISGTSTAPSSFAPNRGSEPGPPGLGAFGPRPPNPPTQGQRPGQDGMTLSRPHHPAQPSANFDAAAGLPDDVFDEPKQVWTCRGHLSAATALLCV